MRLRRACTLLVDEGGVGGQAISSSMIRNYLGFPRGVTGSRLAELAYEQAWSFRAASRSMTRVDSLSRKAEGYSLTLSDGREVGRARWSSRPGRPGAVWE